MTEPITTEQRPEEAQRSGDSGGLLGDDPIDSPHADEFDRAPFVARIDALLRNVSSQTESAVFGLIGPWGSGKTSVLNLLSDIVEESGDWDVLRFNPWQLSDADGLLAEFLDHCQRLTFEGQGAAQ